MNEKSEGEKQQKIEWMLIVIIAHSVWDCLQSNFPFAFHFMNIEHASGSFFSFLNWKTWWTMLIYCCVFMRGLKMKRKPFQVDLNCTNLHWLNDEIHFHTNRPQYLLMESKIVIHHQCQYYTYFKSLAVYAERKRLRKTQQCTNFALYSSFLFQSI